MAAGVGPARAIRHATLIPARHYGFTDRGAVAPGYRADLLVVDDLSDFQPAFVIKGGDIVAREGRYESDAAAPGIPFENTVHLPDLEPAAFTLPLAGEQTDVIAIVPDQITTRHEVRCVHRDDGHWSFRPEDDVVLIASIERHRATGHVGVGLVSGFGIRRRGALGSSVAHDSHNLIIAGTDPRDMVVCARALAESGGGFVVVQAGRRTAHLPLPVAGLLSTEPAEAVCSQLREVRKAARELGCPLTCPFGTLSFLALSVIPELRITDQGLFDVVKQEFVGK